MIVLADGCFDPLHMGHVRYLQASARFGTLHVNVAPDEAIEAKGRTPFQGLRERLSMVESIYGVDSVGSKPLHQIVLDLRPNLLVKGSDWCGRLPAGVIEACLDVGTLVVYTDTITRSSTERLTGCDPGDMEAHWLDQPSPHDPVTCEYCKTVAERRRTLSGHTFARCAHDRR